MVKATSRRKVVKALANGQITIQAEFREALGIAAETLLTVSLVGDHLEVAPLRQGEETLRRYTDEDISRFLEEDKLDEANAGRVRELLECAAVRRGLKQGEHEQLRQGPVEGYQARRQEEAAIDKEWAGPTLENW